VSGVTHGRGFLGRLKRVRRGPLHQRKGRRTGLGLDGLVRDILFDRFVLLRVARVKKKRPRPELGVDAPDCHPAPLRMRGIR
jgi:hypothetical protein